MAIISTNEPLNFTFGSYLDAFSFAALPCMKLEHYYKFIKFTYNDDRVFGFCLDDVILFESEQDDNTKVILSNGREEALEIETNEFCAKVFSDENQTKEYNLVEITNDKIKVVVGGTEL